MGGGLTGLSCGKRLFQANHPFLLIDAASQVGGRVQTENVDGFLCDRGFQVLLTAYPEAQRTFDFDQLNLRPLDPGALIRQQGKFHGWVDPLRRPGAIFSMFFSPVGTLGDKLKIVKLRNELSRLTLEQIFARPESSTLDALRQRGFSSRIIDRFFKPFMRGIFLERDLATSSRKFEFVFKMFARR